MNAPKSRPSRPARPASPARPSRPAQARRANGPAHPPAGERSVRPARPASAGPATTRRPERTVLEESLGVRVSKRMSELGMASRREADEWIARGWVFVDGVPVELGSRVLPHQRITLDGRARQAQRELVTVLLNKPVGYVSGQAEDGYEPARVLVTADNHWRADPSPLHFRREHLASLVPAGRLDIDSVGLLVLTQDGRIAKELIGQDSELEKEYLVRVVMKNPHNELSPASLQLLRHGLELDGEPLKPARVEWADTEQLRFVLKEGKKRQIRRMCEAVGLKVLRLKRVRIGRVMLGDLPTGKWRYLRDDERF